MWVLKVCGYLQFCFSAKKLIPFLVNLVCDVTCMCLVMSAKLMGLTKLSRKKG